MREGIGKYRGKIKSGYYKGRWAHGSLVVAEQFVKHMPSQHMPAWIVTSAFGNGGWFNIRNRVCVDPATVGQFTGLKDKNGVDIYEGDRFNDPDDDGIDYRVVFCADIGGFAIQSYGTRGALMEYGFDEDAGGFGLLDTDALMKCDCDWLEIIGNIHDNPELIK